MFKSIAGKYRDIVGMTTVVNINHDILFNVWNNVVTKLSDIGFDIAVTMTDGHSSNMKLFNKRILADCPSESLSIFRGMAREDRIFLLYDTVHLFKNFF